MFERLRRQPVSDEVPDYEPDVPQHWPTERLIHERPGEYATREEIQGLSDEELVRVQAICDNPNLAPDECIPCFAYAELQERERTRLLPDGPPSEEPTDFIHAEMPEFQVERDGLDADNVEDFEGPPVRRVTPVEMLVHQVGQLQETLQQIVEGDPIPPKEVSLDDLALLTVAAQRWIRMTEAQGVDLGPEQQQVLDATKALVSRLHHD
jgi:hypothetical protein